MPGGSAISNHHMYSSIDGGVTQFIFGDDNMLMAAEDVIPKRTKYQVYLGDSRGCVHMLNLYLI